MKKIFIIKDKYALVDVEDFKYLQRLRWHISNSGYAQNGRELMHRILMNNPAGKDVDHINGNKLDNRKSNLRVCSRSENIQRGKQLVTNTTGYKGVNWYKQTNRWRAGIMHNQKHIHLGYFHDIKEAAKAYDTAAKEIYGHYAKLNHA